MSVAIDKLRQVVAQLRHPEDGCPWDLRQTHDSLTPYLVEEAYELIDAIASDEPEAMREELGDVLFQVLIHCQVAEDQGRFDFDAVADQLAEKMIRRHPHVFGSGSPARPDEADLRVQWARIKAEEKASSSSVGTENAVAAVKSGRPALHYARSLGEKAAEHGFDWPDTNAVLEKISEEVDEIRTADTEGLAEEIGDLLFASVQLCRKAGLDPELVLHRAANKFRQRFLAMAAEGEPWPETLEDWDRRWERVKKN